MERIHSIRFVSSYIRVGCLVRFIRIRGTSEGTTQTSTLATINNSTETSINTSHPRCQANKRFLSFALFLSFQTFTVRTFTTMGNSSSASTLPALQTVANCDTAKFMGTWFVIAVKPTVFEKTCSNSVEKYSFLKDSKSNDSKSSLVDEYSHNRPRCIVSP